MIILFFIAHDAQVKNTNTHKCQGEQIIYV